MIAAALAGLVLASSGGGVQALSIAEPKAACRLASAARIAEGAAYRIRGVYLADGMHGATFQLPGCDIALAPRLDGAAYDRSQRYHAGFDRTCKSYLRGDYMSGLFTGYFIRRPVQRFGMSAPAMLNIFVITDVETKDEDPTAITCPK